MEPYIKIICEGSETEPNYFNSWLKSIGLKLINPAFKPKNHSPLGVVNAAKEEYKKAKLLKIPNNRIFIFAVFDRDKHDGVPEAFDALKNSPIKAIFSNICFEYWILLHFEFTTKAFSSCDEIISYIKKKHDPSYGKQKDNFQIFQQQIPKAIEHANRLKKLNENETLPIWEQNPYCNVQEILETNFYPK
jgi:hypothetical protein